MGRHYLRPAAKSELHFLSTVDMDCFRKGSVPRPETVGDGTQAVNFKQDMGFISWRWHVGTAFALEYPTVETRCDGGPGGPTLNTWKKN